MSFVSTLAEGVSALERDCLRVFVFSAVVSFNNGFDHLLLCFVFLFNFHCLCNLLRGPDTFVKQNS